MVFAVKNKQFYHFPLKQLSFQGCFDEYAKCPEWARSGACGINPKFMAFNCRESCGACGFKSGIFKFGVIHQVKDL